MSLVVSPSPLPSRRPASRRGAHTRTRPSATRRASVANSARQPLPPSVPLARYFAPDGRTRELLSIPGHAGSVLVLDRDAITLRDRRLVAHLATDEPTENVQIVCRLYLADAEGRWCRGIERADLVSAPLAGEDGAHVEQHDSRAPILDRAGNAYELRVQPGERAGGQLRWCRRAPQAPEDRWEQVGLREVVASLESYEPVRALTQRALVSYRGQRGVSLARLEAEFERMASSPIVLNRRLREATLEAISTRGLSMSEIAHRCGMVKCDRRGRLSGETSWLARRIGIMPEGGESSTTPWVHSDVLGLIARKGLGLSPREVEL